MSWLNGQFVFWHPLDDKKNTQNFEHPLNFLKGSDVEFLKDTSQNDRVKLARVAILLAGLGVRHPVLCAVVQGDGGQAGDGCPPLVAW